MAKQVTTRKKKSEPAIKRTPAEIANAIEDIRARHKDRRYAMKIQQKIDRALESFVRINCTEWRFDADEKERKKFNEEVKKIIALARSGAWADPRIVGMVQNTDKGREPFDGLRDASEKQMENLAKLLPVADWVKSIHGAGLLGLATIVGEVGNLSNYPNPAKLWKRLGFAPYQGFAGSTWKREKWRPRALTKEEWIDNPFSGQRYALMHQLAVWLVNQQWIAAKKTGTGEGKPNGHYGEIYAKRRKHTAGTHPDWTKQHSRMDGLRITMKQFLVDLWARWREIEGVVERPPPQKQTSARAQEKQPATTTKRRTRERVKEAA